MRNSIKVILIGLIVIALVGLAAFVYLYIQAPMVSEQIPESTLVVTLVEPSSGLVLIRGGAHTVRAEVVGPDDVIAVELWESGNLIGISQVAATGGYSYQAKWAWIPAASDTYQLYARAFDRFGQVVVSNPVEVTVTDSDNGVAMETYTAQEGDTLAEIAQAQAVSLEDLLTYNSISEPEEPLKGGEKIYLPIGQIGPLASNQTAQEPSTSPPVPPSDNVKPSNGDVNAIQLWLGGRFSSPETLPESPSLAGEAAGCFPLLLIGDESDNELGFLIYRFNENSGKWALIDTIQANSGPGTLSYQGETPLPAQGALYMVEAFNNLGKTASVPVQIKPANTDMCEAIAWQGISIEDDVLVAPPDFENVYMYVSLGNGQFQRVPSQDEIFLPPVENGYDLSPFLGDMPYPRDPDQVEVLFEVWGWQGGSLSRIGSGEAVGTANQDFPFPASSKLEISGFGTFSDVSLGSDEANIRPEPWDLSWYGENLPSTVGRVQISLMPFDDTASLNPPGLIAEKAIPSGLFSIDFGEILEVELEISTEPETTAEILQDNAGTDAKALAPSGVGLYPGASSGSQSPLQFGTQSGDLQVSPISSNLLGRNPLNLYIRVVPLNGGKIAGNPTNTVIAHYVPPDPNAPEFEFVAPRHVDPIYQSKIVELVPPDFADPNRWGCVTVIGHDNSILGSYMGADELKRKYPIGKEICPKSYKGGNDYSIGKIAGDVFDGFKSLFNYVTGLYNDIKAYAINLALDILPCGDLEDVCKAVVSAAVDYGLAAVGLPPSLPNFDQFANAAKGEMVDLIVDEAVANSPVPCPDICKDELHKAIESTIDTAVEEMTKTSVSPGCVSEEEAHQHGREPWCPPPGIIVKPAPGATDQPASAVVEISLLPGVTAPQDYPECRIFTGISVSKFFEAQNWSGAGGYLKYPIEAQTVTMNPYLVDSFAVKQLSPGETAEFVVVFDKIVPLYYLPWTLDMYRNSQEAPNWKRDWYAAVRFSDATFTVKSGLPYLSGEFTETSSCVVQNQIQFEIP